MPDVAWYNRFYIAVEQSPAYAVYCEQVFGCNLAQQGFSDTAQLELMLNEINVKSGERMLDVGCGNGRMLEYLCDRTGAQGEGFDASAVAIAQAQKRTVPKAERLLFVTGLLDEQVYPAASFDVVIAVDSLYFSLNLPQTLRKLCWWLKPGGRLAVFYSPFRFSSEEPASGLEADDTLPARSLQAMGVPYRYIDCTDSHIALMKRKRITAAALRERFAAEGNLNLYENAYTEAVDVGLSPETFRAFSRRYLYLVSQ
ncbi:MAG: class I SAM-dependent methyltransferase [Eubacteriales bacterium]|nr:class I SAM-dependent methyltransferase [Eubacteriales bacterium]